ncbi:MAG: uncharacterized protein A8A55_1102 [Amphiamblys sp. WSBS2006]|nr:MAG: uncharacterized protein A8A55_1102 [Amphiamblys sp. WSBS2006]
MFSFIRSTNRYSENGNTIIKTLGLRKFLFVFMKQRILIVLGHIGGGFLKKERGLAYNRDTINGLLSGAVTTGEFMLTPGVEIEKVKELVKNKIVYMKNITVSDGLFLVSTADVRVEGKIHLFRLNFGSVHCIYKEKPRR